MKIVCLIRSAPPLIYFVNRINEKHRVSLVVVESPPAYRMLINKIKSDDILNTVYFIANFVFEKVKKTIRCPSVYKNYFGDKWKSINDDIPILKVEDINSQIVYERLIKEQPDLILDHGTSLVKDNILGTAHLALNLHWALSPYYRGTHCTGWALINWDPYNIGVTIHKLTKTIDGGDILGQERAIIREDDTVTSINMQLTKLGTEIIIRAIDKIKSGEQLHFKPQDYSLGFMTVSKQWSRYCNMQIRNIERTKMVRLILRKPARKQKLKIVELK